MEQCHFDRSGPFACQKAAGVMLPCPVLVSVSESRTDPHLIKAVKYFVSDYNNRDALALVNLRQLPGCRRILSYVKLLITDALLRKKLFRSPARGSGWQAENFNFLIHMDLLAFHCRLHIKKK